MRFLIYGGKFGFPQTKVLREDLHQKCLHQDWDGLEKRSGLKEGSGVFAKKVFEKSEYLCNYGGRQVSKVEAEKNLLPDVEKCNYLVELREKSCNGIETFYIDFDPSKEKTYGQLLNHSKQHANAIPRTYAVCSNVLDVVFLAKRKINPGKQIRWDYGKNFRGVNECVDSCLKCKKGLRSGIYGKDI